MGEQTKHQESSGVDQIYKRDAVELARTLNANIGIVAYGKAFYFYQGLLEEMERKSGMTIELGHLVELCREEGKEIGPRFNRCFVSLNALGVSEEEWLQDLKEIGDAPDGGTVDEEEDDEEMEDEGLSLSSSTPGE